MKYLTFFLGVLSDQLDSFNMKDKCSIDNKCGHNIIKVLISHFNLSPVKDISFKSNILL